MTPTELRRAAERCRDNSVAQNAAVWRGCSPHEWEWSQEQQEEMARYCLEASHCVDHILATVREDDDTPLDLEFVKIQPLTRYHAGTLYLLGGLNLEVCSDNHNCKPCYLVGRDGLRLETRGQLRRLLEGLGVS